MTTYGNAGDNANISTDIGGPSLGASDIVNVLTGDVDYSTNLTALGSTAFAEFNTGPGYKGNLGDYPSGLQVPADQVVLNDGGRRHAIRSVASHTMDKLVWKNLAGGELSLHNIDTLTLFEVSAPGKIMVQDSAIVVTARINAGGVSVTFEEAGTALTLLEVAGTTGQASAFIERDATTVTVRKNGRAVARESCSPTTVNNHGGRYEHQSDGALTNCAGSGGAVFDFSKAKGDSSSIAWTITGPITIIKPPYGITIDMPTSGEAGTHEVTYLAA